MEKFIEMCFKTQKILSVLREGTRLLDKLCLQWYSRTGQAVCLHEILKCGLTTYIISTDIRDEQKFAMLNFNPLLVLVCYRFLGIHIFL